VKVIFKDSFTKDLRSVKEKGLLKGIKMVIDSFEKADSLFEIQNLKKIRGGDNFYRVRVGDFRIGISYSDNTVFFIRFINRKDIYKYFP